MNAPNIITIKPQLPDGIAKDLIQRYVGAGLALVPIRSNDKRPRTPGWNRKENAVTTMAQWEAMPVPNVGLLHAWSSSPTCAIDLDSVTRARVWLEARGINLDALLQAADAVQIVSGRPDRAKLIYRLPFGPMLSKRISDGNGMILEFRCASRTGNTEQDVLPPSRHPSGTTYQWAGDGSIEKLPMIPPELLEVWQQLIDQDGQRSIPSGNGHPDASWSEIRSALFHLDPDSEERDKLWLPCLMALHYAGETTGQRAEALALADEWSQAGSKGLYAGEKDIIDRFKSFKVRDDGVKLGTLFHLAIERGWKRPMPDVSELFQPVPGCAPDGYPLREWGNEPWPEPHDVRAATEQSAPEYEDGLLPEIYERMMRAQVAYWPNANAGFYAGAFGAAVAQHLPTHVAVETRAGSKKFTTLMNYTGLIAFTGKGKDKTMNAALGIDDDGSLLVWNRDIYKKYAMPPDSKGKASFTPKILHRKFSVEAMRMQIDINHNTAKVPANVVSPEMYDALEGGSAHNQSAFESINSFYCAKWDGGYDSSMSFSHGNSQSEGGVLNMMFCTVPPNLEKWKYLDDAMRSGLMARIDLFTNTQPMPDWCKSATLDKTPVRHWTATQARLHDLPALKLFLAPCSVQEEVDKLVAKGNRLTDQGARHAGWLNKLQIKFARLAAQMTMVEMMTRPQDFPMETFEFGQRVTIPARVQEMAWNYLTRFAWPHQCFIHNELLAGEDMREALMHYARQMFIKKKTRYQRDELVGSKALLTRVRNWPEPMKDKLVQLMIGYDWISPMISTHRVFRTDQPTKCGVFEVNPKFFHVFDKHAKEMHEEQALLMGSIDGRIKPGKNGE